MTLLLSAIFVFFAGLATGLAIASLLWCFKITNVLKGISNDKGTSYTPNTRQF